VYGDANFMLITMDCVGRKYQNSLRSLSTTDTIHHLYYNLLRKGNAE
jgi:hypothetical protein